MRPTVVEIQIMKLDDGPPPAYEATIRAGVNAWARVPPHAGATPEAAFFGVVDSLRQKLQEP